VVPFPEVPQNLNHITDFCNRSPSAWMLGCGVGVETEVEMMDPDGIAGRSSAPIPPTKYTQDERSELRPTYRRPRNTKIKGRARRRLRPLALLTEKERPDLNIHLKDRSAFYARPPNEV
jgi:hypothetical protein